MPASSNGRSPSTGLLYIVYPAVRAVPFFAGGMFITGALTSTAKPGRKVARTLRVFCGRALGYAVMSNHVHVVLHGDPQVASVWSDEEVAERWVRLFLVRVGGVVDERLCEENASRLQGDPERVAELRSRLRSLSWFMRCLNEPMARQANCEDGCTDRFWEGRFKCQALLDEQAVLSCMAYVDLTLFVRESFTISLLHRTPLFAKAYSMQKQGRFR